MVWISIVGLCLITWLSGFAIASLLTGSKRTAQGDRALFAFPLGSAAVGWIAFLASEFAGFAIDFNLVAGILLLLGIPGAIFLYQTASRNTRSGKANERPAWSALAWVQFGIIAIVFLRHITETITEPYIGLDALRYHLPYAHIIFSSQHLSQFTSPSMGDLFFTSPPLPFLWYGIGWTWIGSPHLFLPNITGVVFAAHLCILLYRMARRLFDVGPEIALAVVICVSLPGIFTNIVQVLRSTTDIPFAF